MTGFCNSGVCVFHIAYIIGLNPTLIDLWTITIVLPPVKLFFSSSCSDAADQLVQGKGKFEELMVCSHEIAASTAQLVAASKVQQQIASNICTWINFKAV